MSAEEIVRSHSPFNFVLHLCIGISDSMIINYSCLLPIVLHLWCDSYSYFQHILHRVLLIDWYMYMHNCGYNIMILCGLPELVSLFQNIYATPTIQCRHWGWSLPGSLSGVLSGSITSQVETGPTLTWFSYSQGIHNPQCWEPCLNIKYTMHAITYFIGNKQRKQKHNYNISVCKHVYSKK